MEGLEREKSMRLARQLAEDNRVTIGDAATRFKQTYTGASANRQVADSTLRIYRWTVDKYIIPHFGHYPLDEVPIDEIMDFIEDLAETRPTASNQLHAIFSAFFKWVTKQRRYNSPELGDRWFRRNPLAGVDRPASTVRKNRVLDFKVSHKKLDNKGEFKRFWAWLPTINPGHANALRLLTLTGMRPSEVLGLQWEDIFADEIIVPAVKMKSQHDVHRLPFSPQLEALINDIRSTAVKTGDTDYLFPKRPRSLGSPDKGERSYPHVGHATLSNHILQALRSDELDIEPFTPHDIRRSVATHVGDLGFAPSEVDALQHHALPSLAATYNYSDPKEKKLSMLTAWHNRLDELILGQRTDNVVGIRATR
jgi:integrase